HLRLFLLNTYYGKWERAMSYPCVYALWFATFSAGWSEPASGTDTVALLQFRPDVTSPPPSGWLPGAVTPPANGPTGNPPWISPTAQPPGPASTPPWPTGHTQWMRPTAPPPR